jgi:hypothetical protein
MREAKVEIPEVEDDPYDWVDDGLICYKQQKELHP